MLWDPKTSKISQNTKIAEFSALIENKYDVKIGRTNSIFSLSKLYFLRNLIILKEIMMNCINGLFKIMYNFGKNFGIFLKSSRLLLTNK